MHMLNSELQTLITSSSLVDFEQEIIAGALGRLDETFQETLATLCTGHIWLIPYLYINYAQKRYALKRAIQILCAWWQIVNFSHLKV